MRFIRSWNLPTRDEPVIEYLDKDRFWGQHFFWYCSKCRHIYATVTVQPEDCAPRPWQGISGLCMTCLPNPFAIRGMLNGAHMIGLEVPYEVAQYMLDREIDFIGHPAHPHNEVA